MLLFIENHNAVMEIDVQHKMMMVYDGLGYDGSLAKWTRHATHILKKWSILPVTYSGKRFVTKNRTNNKYSHIIVVSTHT
jgi:hypothetical protein